MKFCAAREAVLETESLNDKEKIVLGYCYNCMFTQEETALMMGCDARTVRRYKTMALDKLKKALA